MTGLFTLARQGVMVATASAVLALAAPVVANAHGGHHHHGKHHHHGHGHHHHHGYGHYHQVYFHYYGGGRCRYWRHECAGRWGWSSPGYDRCLWRHGC